MLGLKDTITFGQYKGKRIEEVLNINHGYLGWLRVEKMKSGIDLLTPEADKALQAKTKMKNLPKRVDKVTLEATEKLAAEMKEPAKREEAYKDSWGEW